MFSASQIRQYVQETYQEIIISPTYNEEKSSREKEQLTDHQSSKPKKFVLNKKNMKKWIEESEKKYEDDMKELNVLNQQLDEEKKIFEEENGMDVEKNVGEQSRLEKETLENSDCIHQSINTSTGKNIGKLLHTFKIPTQDNLKGKNWKPDISSSDESEV